ncbi:hypothetical protein QAD02_007817 [Eretmocerus hayati]|uniref:Uncharacterized protein n=1 Tax=Eretmocerus hayati TaxID=131215 RepID=A0ACC2N4P3_9HYME|nr:hypothetical protein QAD02_007817 [Eretmocerus hayati]
MVRIKATSKKFIEDRADINSTRLKGVTTPHRIQPGTPVQRHNILEKKNGGFVIKKRTFQRIVRDIARSFKEGIKFQSAAVMALQEVSEQFLVEVFADANSCAQHVHRVTVIARDMELANLIRSKRY